MKMWQNKLSKLHLEQHTINTDLITEYFIIDTCGFRLFICKNIHIQTISGTLEKLALNLANLVIKKIYRIELVSNCNVQYYLCKTAKCCGASSKSQHIFSRTGRIESLVEVMCSAGVLLILAIFTSIVICKKQTQLYNCVCAMTVDLLIESSTMPIIEIDHRFNHDLLKIQLSSLL